ncbi:UxaA family hydrolase [Roseobacter weihaiensis]|uniref:UxaA family hydrolase n=1 Tax=Roseobacter weihaiensis TaxID=2763262 RepID=UPI001D0AF8A8|nr:UxaA family hydrolase [Roseobacter sp. H9]
MAETAKLLHLHARDNIAVLAQDTAAGAVAALGTAQFRIVADLSMGHKIAIHPIPAGADILKYGCPIGFAAQDIAAGEHVHLHNLTSRYTVIEDMEAAGT